MVNSFAKSKIVQTDQHEGDSSDIARAVVQDTAPWKIKQGIIDCGAYQIVSDTLLYRDSHRALGGSDFLAFSPPKSMS